MHGMVTLDRALFSLNHIQQAMNGGELVRRGYFFISKHGSFSTFSSILSIVVWWRSIANILQHRLKVAGR